MYRIKVYRPRDISVSVHGLLCELDNIAADGPGILRNNWQLGQNFVALAGTLLKDMRENLPSMAPVKLINGLGRLELAPSVKSGKADFVADK